MQGGEWPAGISADCFSNRKPYRQSRLQAQARPSQGGTYQEDEWLCVCWINGSGSTQGERNCKTNDKTGLHLRICVRTLQPDGSRLTETMLPLTMSSMSSQVDVPFNTFYKTFTHPGHGMPPLLEDDNEEKGGLEEFVTVSAQCPECVNSYLDCCRKYNTEANAGDQTQH